MTNRITPEQATSRPHSLQQSRNDDRDNSRVFAFFIIVAVLVFAGALAYFFIVDKHAEGPARGATPPAAQMQDTTPAK
jgi:heme/copper-type cytochrome/quinol oxidase subunit 3